MKIYLSVLFVVFFIEGTGLDSLAAGALGKTEVPRKVLNLGRETYQANCAVCHGVNGDGNGTAASMFLIRPRNFRSGVFKFRSTESGSLPTDDDLYRTVTRGIRWTGMIGRPDLPEEQINAVIQYIKTFSPRFSADSPGKTVDVPLAATQNPESLAKGEELYLDLGCLACHGKEGQGNGPSAQGLKDDWGWPITASDLTWRPLKRGSDPKGIYLTLITGLSGTPMPSYAGSLTLEDTWALIYYLESLVPSDRRLSPRQVLGEEHHGWMALRMGGMMGGGRVGPMTPR